MVCIHNGGTLLQHGSQRVCSCYVELLLRSKMEELEILIFMGTDNYCHEKLCIIRYKCNKLIIAVMLAVLGRS